MHIWLCKLLFQIFQTDRRYMFPFEGTSYCPQIFTFQLLAFGVDTGNIYLAILTATFVKCLSLVIF